MRYPWLDAGDLMINAHQMRSLWSLLGTLLDAFRAWFPKTNSFRHLAKNVPGLMTDVPRESIEPITLAWRTPVRTLFKGPVPSSHG